MAERLGCSVSSVRRLEGKALHPEQSAAGVWLFDAAEVEALDVASRPRARSQASGAAEGTIASRVFLMLEAGHDLREIVIATRTPPRLVRELYAEWLMDLEGGEQRRREAAQAAQEAQERAREERELAKWEKQMRELMRR